MPAGRPPAPAPVAGGAPRPLPLGRRPPPLADAPRRRAGLEGSSAELREVRDKLTAMGLTKQEVLQVVNTCPQTGVEAYVCISEPEERGFEMEAVEEIVALVQATQGKS